MPWGKHKGEDLMDIPMSYLGFIIEDCTNVDRKLKNCIEEEIRRRVAIPIEQEYKLDPIPIIKNWYRKAAVAAHPDHGGSVQFMKLLNELIEIIEE